MGRRVRKEVLAWEDGAGDWAATATTDLKFVYDGWNVVQVLDGTTTGKPVTQQYTWGLDLSGTMQGAGGIGGLLAVDEVAGTYAGNSYWFTYDGNGNVGQLLNADDQTLAAHYEYDPYGNIILASDVDTSDYVNVNPIRFSTKWFDEETGMGYWGKRYLDFELGRWANRDPIEEEGGLNLYAFVLNSPVVRNDPKGLTCLMICVDACGFIPISGHCFCFPETWQDSWAKTKANLRACADERCGKGFYYCGGTLDRDFWTLGRMRCSGGGIQIPIRVIWIPIA